MIWGGAKREFILEDSLIRYSEIRELICKRNQTAASRTGWYLQQFLKMQYAFICPDSCYLLWDSDTIPLKQFSFFENGQFVFDMKTEFHEPYFHTMYTILKIKKYDKRSFISEHMIISTGIMKQMIRDIESITGKRFYEGIIDAIEDKELPMSGFSEFETYGTYAMRRFPKKYKLRNWKSLRDGGRYYLYEDLSETEKTWLAGGFDAISFEKNTEYDEKSNKKIQNLWLRLFFPADKVVIICNHGFIKILQAISRKVFHWQKVRKFCANSQRKCRDIASNLSEK